MTYKKPEWITKMEIENKERKQKLNQLFKACEKHVEIMNKLYSYEKFGLVHTSFEKQVEEYKSFMVWVDNGLSINHKIISINELTI